MNTQNVTLEQLAERFNQSIWIKGDLKRIYLNDEGFNTKKMSTKTFIYEKDGEFLVSCRIECVNQPYKWIQSQEEELKNSVNLKIEDYIRRILDSSIDAKEAQEEAEMAIILLEYGRSASVMSTIGELVIRKICTRTLCIMGMNTITSSSVNRICVSRKGLRKFTPLLIKYIKT